MALRGHIGRLIGERERGGMTRERGRELTFPGP
jgi:hypothetical protein